MKGLGKMVVDGIAREQLNEELAQKEGERVARAEDVAFLRSEAKRWRDESVRLKIPVGRVLGPVDREASGIAAAKADTLEAAADAIEAGRARQVTTDDYTLAAAKRPIAGLQPCSTCGVYGLCSRPGEPWRCVGCDEPSEWANARNAQEEP